MLALLADFLRHPAVARALRRLADQRGQAMVEYSTITLFLLLSAAVVGFNSNLPGMNVPLAQALYGALQTYVDSFYFSLSLKAP